MCAMEDVLDVYQRPRDPRWPLVTLDEANKQLVADVTPPVPFRPGRPARQDYEYERRGTANLFMLFAPLEGWRHVKVTDRRTIVDFASVLRDLADVHFPDAEQIVLVMDNLNTHKLSTLYRVFPPEEARRLWNCSQIRDAGQPSVCIQIERLVIERRPFYYFTSGGSASAYRSRFMAIEKPNSSNTSRKVSSTNARSNSKSLQ